MENRKAFNFMDVLSPIHFYASCYFGWSLFQNIVYPFAHFSQETTDLVKLVPMYFLNVLAFTCLVYVATRPIVLLVDHILNCIDEMLADFTKSRR